jgi:hypothetical protein
MPNQPLTREEVSSVLNKLSIFEQDNTDRYLEAALHLATPKKSVIGIDITLERDLITWRGATIKCTPGRGLEDAVSLATSRWRKEDEALDLEGSFLKPLRSGAHNIVYGTFLYNAPHVLCGTEVDNPAEVAQAYLKNRVNEAAANKIGPGSRVVDGVVEILGNTYLVHGGEKSLYIHGVEGGKILKNLNLYDTKIVGEIVKDYLKINDLEEAKIGSRLAGTLDVDYVGRFFENGACYEVIVPCTVGGGLNIGAAYGVASPDTFDWYSSRKTTEPWYKLRDYTPIEPARLEPGWVARHEPSGTTLIVRLLSDTDQ